MAARPALIRAASRAGIALAVIALFLLAGWIGSSIPRNGGWREPARGIEIMVETNGIHTGIVMPIVTSQKDWRETFPTAAQPTPHGHLPTHIAVGWGETEVFMNTATWADLGPLTALRIATVGGDSVMRVAHYANPLPGEYHRPLRITARQYARIVRRIEATLAPPRPDGSREVLRGFTPGDAYFEARGTYTLVNTCNSWVGDTLGDAGITMGWWTPFAGGVMKWVPKPYSPRARAGAGRRIDGGG